MVLRVEDVALVSHAAPEDDAEDAEGDEEDWAGENKEPISILHVGIIKLDQLETRLHQADDEADRGGDHDHQEGVEPV